ncbi:MAG: aldose epimerase family protein, partial [Chitinophagaceae bacterium]
NSLHGGKKGFDSKVWDASQPDSTHLILSYQSKNMEEGYPGNLKVQVTYTLTGNNGIKIDYTASTDRNTVLNLTNHTYFNLSGEGNPSILNEVMMINANRYTPVDSTSIPTGELASVQGTPFDFRIPTPIGARINENNDQLKNGKGYDHNFVLNKNNPDSLSLAAEVYAPITRIDLKVYTTQPGLQFYTSNFLDGSIIGKRGRPYLYRSAFCLETQHFPDSPNEPGFPSTELKKGQTFHSETIYQFGIK